MVLPPEDEGFHHKRVPLPARPGERQCLWHSLGALNQGLGQVAAWPGAVAGTRSSG